jgi:hypothetical protein
MAPSVTGVEAIEVNGNLLGRVYSIAPDGYIVVPALKELPPVFAHSETGHLDLAAGGGIPQLVRDLLHNRAMRIIGIRGSLDEPRPTPGQALFDQTAHEAWDLYAIDQAEFDQSLTEGGDIDPLTEVGPLLTTLWDQGPPYNDYCPMGDGGRCVAGCVATAAAQIMRYHRCPNNGIGSHSYTWDGDQSCGGDVGGGTLSATFSDAYDWGFMPDDCSGGCSAEQEAALAELCYEVGVAFEMDYGVCGSGCATSYATTVYPTYFGYDSSIDKEDRSAHTAGSWFNIIKNQVNADQPMQYSTIGHSIVIDGWRDTGGTDQYHINYGWGNSTRTGWFAIDDIPGYPDASDDYLIRNIIPQCTVNQAPVADCRNITVSANASCVAHASVDDGSYDPEGQPVTTWQVPPGPYSLGDTPVTLYVQDDIGWITHCMGMVTVEDNTPPLVTCPANDITVEAVANCACPSSDAQLAGWFGSGSATDNCSSPALGHDAPASFPMGTTAVTWTATDPAGNSSTCSRDVTVVDTTPPALTCPASAVTVEATDHCGCPLTDTQLVSWFGQVSATDNCPPYTILSDAPACFPLGTTTVTFTATDAAGNASQCSQDVTVEDTTPPEMTCAPDYNAPCGDPIVFTDPVVTDIGDPNPTVIIVSTTTVEGPGPAEHTHTRTWRATDASGNSSECSQSVLEESCENDFIYLDIPDDIVVNPGDDIQIPVTAMDLTSWGVMAFNMRICWCELPEGLLEFEDCSIGPVMNASNWMYMACNECTDNCVSVAAAGPAPLVGEGVLFYLNFHVSQNAKPCMCCKIEFDEVNMYDPEIPLLVQWDDGEVCVEYCRVSGCVNYWKCCVDDCGQPYYAHALEGAEVSLVRTCDTHGMATMYTGSGGCYDFDCLEPLGPDCYFTVDVDYCNHLDCINAFDAALILHHLTCSEGLDDCVFDSNGATVRPQMVAADVTCSNGITSYDATLILQRSVGLAFAFPCPAPWAFFPVGPGGSRVDVCPGLVDWIGVYKGDVDGCFRCVVPPPAGDAVTVALGAPTDLGDRIEVPIVVQGAYDILSGEYDLTFDSSDLGVNTVTPTGLAAGSLSAYNATDGTLKIAMAAGQSYGGDGEVATITFDKVDPGADLSSVELTDVLFNNGEPPAVIGGTAGVDVQPATTTLKPAVPNPFTNRTVIGYHLAVPAGVTLEIYSVTGQLVRTLVDGQVGQGDHQAVWDGKDSAGQTASRGVYFCRMETGGFTTTQKIVLIK